MSLTPHQSEKLEESLTILKDGKRLLISGSAGVGKTYLVNELIKRIRKTIPSHKKIICSAPTNKAVAVVKGKVDKADKLEFTTVHSCLKIKRQVNYRNGKVTFKPNFTEKYPPMRGVGALIIDEASMLPTELLKFVEVHATKNNCIVVFIGDHKQLNPVGEEVSPVFTADYPEVELTQIIRQGNGNPIIKLSRDLDLIKTKESDSEDGEGYIYSDNINDVVGTLATVNGTDELKYLAWTNKEVDLINNLVRKKIYGDNPKKIEVGETLTFNSPYKDDYYTNQEVKVNEATVKQRNFHYPTGTKTTKSINLKVYSINPQYSIEAQEYAENIIAIHEDSQADYDKLMKTLKNRAAARTISWLDFYGFSENFADLKYNHAITVHKSQGSTYKQAIVNVKNLNLNRSKTEKERLLYTAVTRASKLLILYKT